MISIRAMTIPMIVRNVKKLSDENRFILPNEFNKLTIVFMIKLINDCISEHQPFNMYDDIGTYA